MPNDSDPWIRAIKMRPLLRAMMSEPPGAFGVAKIKKILGIPRGRLQEWLKWVPPDLEKANGAGTRNLWTLSGLYQLKVFDLLISEFGFSREQAGYWLKQLREQGFLHQTMIPLTQHEDKPVVLDHKAEGIRVQIEINIAEIKSEVDGAAM